MRKQIKLLILGLFFVLSFHSIALSQDESPWDKYKFRTLSEIINFNDIAELKKKTKPTSKIDFISATLFHSKVRLSFIGTSRPISKIHQELMNHWSKSLGFDENTINLYEKEFLFKECNKEFWIPIQKKVSEFFPKELKSGDMVTLFVIHVGGRKETNAKEFDWLFLSTEFEK